MNTPKLKKGKIDFVLFTTILLLVTLGVILVGSASYNSALWFQKDGYYFLKKQFIFSILGTIFMIIALNIDYHKLKKYNEAIMLITIALLLAVFAFPPVNNAQRWITLGPVSIQPSEIAKYTVVLYMAKSVERKGEKVKSLIYGIFPFLLVSGVYAALVLKEKNLSIASVIMIVTVIILFCSGAKMIHLIGLGSLLVAAGVFFTVTASYRMDRLMSFRNPWLDPKKTGYQLIQSLLSLGSGGILGVGFTRSRQKNFMPEPHNDFIFSVIGEELGLIGCIFIITLFVIFIWRGIKTAVNAKDVYGSILAIGITSVVGVQALINIAVATGSMPVTGVPLPFISYGGSALLFNMIAMGVLLNVSRQNNIN
ncbi:stage V sporulation protein E [Clostridium sp. KNHs214]|uniref:stage V sporulation protein E n=1 Tax=Clostridium sp. KNHs214 TaxID=1540257 RepID=UPI000555C485|nr:stage V sporulation protein E [Clostridium sp. KNHs214]